MSERRTRRVVDQVIAALGLDLDGLVVYTEAASGPYLWTPVLAERAGAAHVYALAADSAYHRAADVETATLDLARGRVQVVREKRPEHLAAADVVTNSATLRPITAAEVAALKPTAALPLMWETWEFVESDLDLDACRDRGVIVLGTHEDRAPCDLGPYHGFLAVRLLFELGLEGARTSVALLGQTALGRDIERFLRAAGCDVEAFGAPYGDLTPELARHDALIVAEPADRSLLAGPGGRLEPAALAQVNPDLRIGVIMGEVDAPALRAAGLVVFPERVRGGGRMSYDISVLGPRPVLELYAAGLRVGAATTRARLRGLEVAEAAAEALRDPLAMDFTGDRAWAPPSSSTRTAGSRAAARPTG
jgi:hypothetical protein